MRKMKKALMVGVAAGILELGGCGGSESKPAKNENRPKIYSLEDVNQELRDGGVQLNSTQEDARSFFKKHRAYDVCKDFNGGVIAVMRNKRVDPKADDQYVVLTYRDGKVAYLDIGPPQFSTGNVASYCQ
jgi:hypothetical protein